jgi:hypothetical protein
MHRHGLPVVIVAASIVAAACTHTSREATQYGGTWTMKLGPRTFAVLALTQNGDDVRGTLMLPTR